MPLIRRMPKRGFNNARFTTRYLPVNLNDLNTFEEGSRVDEQALRASGIAKGRADGVKILGHGEIQHKLTVAAHAFSASARSKIEAAGGSCEVIERSPKPARKSVVK
jgi:large subunit ribosomal protein L15